MNDASSDHRLSTSVQSPAGSAGNSALDAAIAPLVKARTEDKPLVVAQLGQSLDGRIATPTGSSRGINGPAAMTHLHRLRALVDAVVVGAGTARTDNPRLTVRHCQGQSPARVVIDPRGTVCPFAQVWSPEDGARRIVFGGSSALDASVERLPIPGGMLEPAWILRTLHGMGFSRVLVEGGGTTVSKFLAADQLDLLHVLVAPVVLGSGLTGLSLPGVVNVAEAARPATAVHVFDGCDVLFACDLRQG